MFRFAFISVFSALTFLVTGASLPAAERPNFVWILSEDNSKHYLKLFDEAGAETPNIAALARDGVIFDRAFSCAPVCSVARTTLATACYGPRILTQFHRRSTSVPLPDGLKMFPAYLRDAGYYTTNNSKKDYNALEGKGVWDESSGKASWRNRADKNQPFFHMQTFGMSHESSLHFRFRQPPRKSGDASPEFPNKKHASPPGLRTSPASVKLADYHPDTPTFRYTYARYHDRIQVIDNEVGKLVERLKSDGLLENTFVFYFADHGGVLPRSKGYAYEAGLHVPLVVRIPERWKGLVAGERGDRTNGFVSFVDFGPTVLHLAGIDVPDQVDGTPFLGPGITVADLNARDETFGHADRFDEKYDLVRTLRKGRYKYIRNYQAYYPDGLQNNYRYRMAAYAEWRQLDRAGKLNAVQSQFFRPRDPEALYDLEADPHEVNNLAADPKFAETTRRLRALLQSRVKNLPDLSFYPESYLMDHAVANPVRFGKARAGEIARLVDVADLALLPFDQARPRLAQSLSSDNAWERYWALTACSCFGDEARPLAAAATNCLEDDERLVRVRAAEFLGLIGEADPRPALYRVLNETRSDVEALITLNTAVLFHDRAIDPLRFDTSALKMKATGGQVPRRIEYLQPAKSLPAGR